MKTEVWFVVTTTEYGIQLHTYGSMKKLGSYFTKKLKLNVLSIKEATREDYNNYFNIKE